MAQDSPLIGRDEAIHLVPRQDGSATPFEYYRAEQELERQNLDAQIRARELLALQGLRVRWSNWILGCIVGITIIDLFTILALGFGLMTFDSKLVVPAFLTESIIKVIGLAIIIVRFLFSGDSLATK